LKYKIILFAVFFSFCFNQGKIDPTYMATFGSVTMNGKVYNQVSFRPEFTTGKLGIGLDLYIYFDEDGNIYSKDWDFSSFESSFKTLIDKIYYIRYGQPFNDIYFRIGALEKVTMGYGILVRHYANNMDYPQIRRLGFDFRYTFSDFRLEFIHSDLKEFSNAGLLGIRAMVPVIPKFDLGFSLVADLNQYGGLLDSDEDGYPDFVEPEWANDPNQWYQYQELNELHSNLFNDLSCDDEIDTGDTSSQVYQDCKDLEAILNSGNDVFNINNKKDIVSGLALDLSYDISDRITVFSEFAQLFGDTSNPLNDPSFDTNLGYGFIPIGFHMNFNSVSVFIDYRKSSENFIFHYWGKNYEHNRVNVSNYDIITKESLLYNYGNQEGTSLAFIANISKYLKFSVNYIYLNGKKWNQEILDYKKDKNNSFYSKFEVDTSRIPRIDIAEIFYQQTNTKKPFDFENNENTLIGYNIGIELADNMSLIFKGRKTFTLDSNGNYNAVKNTQIETLIYF